MNLWIQEGNYSKTVNLVPLPLPSEAKSVSHRNPSFKLTILHIFFSPGKRHFLHINSHPLFTQSQIFLKEKLQITIKNERGRKLQRNEFLTPPYFYAKIKLLIVFRGRAELYRSSELWTRGHICLPLIWAPDFIGYIRVFTTLPSFDKYFVSSEYF